MTDILPDATDPSPEPKTKAGITFRPNEILRQQLELAAKECNQSLNKWIESHFENYFAGPRENIFSVITELREVVTMLKNTAPGTSATPPRPIDPDTLMAESDAQARAGLQAANRKKTTYVPESIAPASPSLVSPLSAANKKAH